MSSDITKVILITANIASCFEQLDKLLQNYLDEVFKPIERTDSKFIALHCQEVGGKDYESSMKNMDLFYMNVRSRAEKLGFTKSCIFLDVEYNYPEKFTALGNLYFIHEDVERAQIWNFIDKVFVDCIEHQEFVGSIENVPIKEKAKFPQEFFPECKWSRKGFMRTRWQLNGTPLDLINIHLFHDASNFVAMETFPSKYTLNRKRAMEYTLDKFHNDCLPNVPLFIFGDFNFRLDTGAVVKELSSNCSLRETDILAEKSKLFVDKEGADVLKISKKEFVHSNHDTIFLYQDGLWLQPFDLEPQQFSNRLCEMPIRFPPSYPFEEDLNSGLGHHYMKTRCPAWCDRILFTHSARQLLEMIDSETNYGMIGLNSKMGDHKPIALSFAVPNEVIVNCCIASTPCANFVHNSTNAASCFLTGDWCRCETSPQSHICTCPDNSTTSCYPESQSPPVDTSEDPFDITLDSTTAGRGSTKTAISPCNELITRNILIKRVQSDPVVAKGWLKGKYTHLQVGHSNSLDSHMSNVTLKLKTTSSRLVSHHSSSSEEWFEQVVPPSSEPTKGSDTTNDQTDQENGSKSNLAALSPTTSDTQKPDFNSVTEKRRCCIIS